MKKELAIKAKTLIDSIVGVRNEIEKFGKTQKICTIIVRGEDGHGSRHEFSLNAGHPLVDDIRNIINMYYTNELEDLQVELNNL
jgi:hypothetical protein